MAIAASARPSSQAGLVAVTTKKIVPSRPADHRIRRHRGHKKAAIAVANALVVTADHVLSRDCDYQELGADYLYRPSTERTQQRAVRALVSLGYRAP